MAGLGLRPVSDTSDRPGRLLTPAEVGCWLLGSRMLVAPGTSAGGLAELCLGGSLDGLRLGSEFWA